MFSTFCCFILLFATCLSIPALRFKFDFDKDTTQRHTLGESAKINCKTNNVKAKVTLFKILSGINKIQVFQGPNVIHGNNDIFTIKQVTAVYFGVYECVAEDVLGQRITKKVQVDFDNSQQKLIMEPDLKVLEIIAGSSFKLTCETNPTSDKLIWFFANDMEEPRFKTITNNQIQGIKQSVLEVMAASPANSGDYYCKRVTLFNMVLATVEMRVEVKIPQLPYFQNPSPMMLNTSEKTSLDLPCKIGGGSPDPVLTWYKDGQVLPTCQVSFTHVCTKIPYRKTTDGLQIVSVDFNRDNGVFTCKASNIAGSVAKTLNVDVLVPPLISLKSQVTTHTRSEFPITCTAVKSNPPPKFIWTLQLYSLYPIFYTSPMIDVLKAPSHRILTSKDGMSSTVVIPDFVSMAYYHCTAINKFGQDTKTVNFERILNTKG